MLRIRNLCTYWTFLAYDDMFSVFGKFNYFNIEVHAGLTFKKCELNSTQIKTRVNEI